MSSARLFLNKKLARHKLLVTRVNISYFPLFIIAVAIGYLFTISVCFVGFNFGKNVSLKSSSSEVELSPVVYDAEISDSEDLLPNDSDLEFEDIPEDLNYDVNDSKLLSDVSVDETFLEDESVVLGVSDKDSTDYMNKPNYDTTVAPVNSTEEKVFVSDTPQDTEINRVSLSKNVNVNNDFFEYITKVAFPVLAISLSVFGVNMFHSLKKPTVGKKAKN